MKNRDKIKAIVEKSLDRPDLKEYKKLFDMKFINSAIQAGLICENNDCLLNPTYYITDKGIAFLRKVNNDLS